ncbi:hypothetical protein JBE27_54590, partial [Streptomyces albiflaviniger]|nr:hypothetical protein [Streptomyces albiflaviniger]
MFVAKNDTFLEKEFLVKEVSGRTVMFDDVNESPEEVERVTELEVISPLIPETKPKAPLLDLEAFVIAVTEPRKTGRVRNPPQWFQNELFILEDDEPANYKEAMTGPSSNEWRKAMQSEMESMYENQVWNLVDTPE